MSAPESVAGCRWQLRLNESLENLRALGLRSWLALLGIMVGSASVVALLDIGHSSREDALRTFTGLGAETLVVSFVAVAGRSPPPPRTLDTDSIKARLPQLAWVAPIRQFSTRVYRGSATHDVSLTGTTAALAVVMDLTLASGRFISPLDNNGLFVVLGAEVATALDGGKGAVKPGDFLRIGNYQFQIIGVLSPVTHNPLLPVSADTSVFMPARSMARISSAASIGNVIARVVPGTDLPSTAQSLKTLLSRSLDDREVEVQVPQQLLDGLERQAQTFTWLLAGLGGISLLVAGVGVMNVMLMSVRERRREIGVRMALGARRRDIRLLFLLEAAHLSVLGALLGAVMGSAIAFLFARVSGWPLSLSPDNRLLGIGSSLLIGLFFGSYPAVVAARLSPAAALRDD